MCNRYKFHLPLDRLAEDFSSIKIPLRFSDDARSSNADITISDLAPIIRPADDGARVDMMRWSWPQGPKNAPLFNFRSEGRTFRKEQRCLIPTDGFYEFTDSAKGSKKKDRWLFTLKEGDLFAIAGIWKPKAASGDDAWTMLTCEPGPDIAVLHRRQVVLLTKDQWADWLGGGSEADLLRPTPAGSLSVAPG